MQLRPSGGSAESAPETGDIFASAMAIDYQDMLEIFLHRMLYPIVHNVAYDLYRQHQNKQPMDGFHKNTRS